MGTWWGARVVVPSVVGGLHLACASAGPASQDASNGSVREDASPTPQKRPVDFLIFQTDICRALYEKTSDYTFIEIGDEDPSNRFWKEQPSDDTWREPPPFNKAGLARKDGWVFVSLSSADKKSNWIKFEDHCFGPDGHLHELHTRYNSYESECDRNGIFRETLQSFDSSGQRSDLKVEVRDMKTATLLQCGDSEVPLPRYRSVTELPFANFDGPNSGQN